jgi:hypothetical protein
MQNRRLKLVGDQYGRLKVIAMAKPGKRGRTCICRCTCGAEVRVTVSHLRAGDTRSCGCLKIEQLIRRSFVHGETPRGCPLSPEYKAWNGMIQRCENVRNPKFHSYGGRGIRVCVEWRHSFSAFLKSLGRRPSKSFSLHRIDNDGDYTPGNVCWATQKIQHSNRRRRNQYLGACT